MRERMIFRLRSRRAPLAREGLTCFLRPSTPDMCRDPRSRHTFYRSSLPMGINDGFAICGSGRISLLSLRQSCLHRGLHHDPLNRANPLIAFGADYEAIGFFGSLVVLCHGWSLTDFARPVSQARSSGATGQLRRLARRDGASFRNRWSLVKQGRGR